MKDILKRIIGYYWDVYDKKPSRSYYKLDWQQYNDRCDIRKNHRRDFLKALGFGIMFVIAILGLIGKLL